MFISSSRRPSVRRREPRAERPEVRLLPQAIEENRALADCAQRGVARGRSAVVDIQARVLTFRGRGIVDFDGFNDRERSKRLAELLANVDLIHQRLLMLLATIELEVDRLEVTRLELDQLRGGR
jgi:hypothetical protein